MDAVRMRGRCRDYCHGDKVTFFCQFLLEKESFKVNGGLHFALDLWEQNIKHIYIKSPLLKLEKQKQPY